MDKDTNVPQMRPGNGSPRPVCTLTRINPQTWSEDRLAWLWQQLQTQDYAFDDTAMELGHTAFLIPLFAPKSEWYEIGDEGLCAFTSIAPRCDASFHFVVWGDIEPRDLFNLQHQLFADIFSRYNLNRISGYIPSFNKTAIRMAMIAGFKFEGELRKSFLRHGTYHNIQVYGLLRDDFYKREVRN